MARTVTLTLSEAQKDRRTRMVKSSFKAPMKKEGGGGSYVWGTSTDVTDFLPVGLGSVRKVSVDQPMRLPEVHVAAPTAQYHLKDPREFPDLTGKVRQALCHEAATSKAHISPYFAPRADPPTVHQLVTQPLRVQCERPAKETKAFAKQKFRQAPGKVLQARAR